MIVSSCNLQSEHSLVSFLLKIKSYLFRYKILVSILYWNIHKLVSFETLCGKRKIFFHSTCKLGKMLQKYFWDVGSSFFRIDKEYSSFGINFSITKIWLFLTKWWFKFIIFLQFPLSFKTANFHGLGIACISWTHLK